MYGDGQRTGRLYSSRPFGFVTARTFLPSLRLRYSVLYLILCCFNFISPPPLKLFTDDHCVIIFSHHCCRHARCVWTTALSRFPIRDHRSTRVTQPKNYCGDCTFRVLAWAFWSNPSTTTTRVRGLQYRTGKANTAESHFVFSDFSRRYLPTVRYTDSCWCPHGPVCNHHTPDIQNGLFIVL